MSSFSKWIHALRSAVLASVVALAGGVAAHAVTIGDGESILVLVNNGQEAYVNLGTLATVDTAGNTTSVSSLSGVDLSGAAALIGGLEGAQAVVLAVDDPGNIMRSVDFGFGPTNLNSFFTTTNADATAYILDSTFDQGIANARPLIDNNGPASFISGLPDISDQAVGAPNSYTSKLGTGLGSQMPFGVTTNVISGMASIDYWFLMEGVNAFSAFGGPPAVANKLGTFDIANGTLSFTPSASTPEPGAALLLAPGLIGLALAARRRRAVARA